MKFKDNIKKFGFSLMEVVLALFIVAILVMVTIPIVNRQLEKSEEYSYYLAYRTVEKMAGQIVSLGDPDEDETAYIGQNDLKIAKANNPTFGSYLYKKYQLAAKKTRLFVASIGNKLVYTEAYILKNFFPKAFAADYEIESFAFQWNSDDYDDLWLAYKVCESPDNTYEKSKTVEMQEVTKEDGTTEQQEVVHTEYYTKNEDNFYRCYGYTREIIQSNSSGFGGEAFGGSGELIRLHSQMISAFFLNENATNSKDALDYSNSHSSSVSAPSYVTSAHTYMMNQTDAPNAKAFCEGPFKTLVTTNNPRLVDDRLTTYSVAFVETEDTTSEDDPDDEEGGEDYSNYVEPPRSEKWGDCVVTAKYTITIDNDNPNQGVTEKPTFAANWCTNHGYTNMTNVNTETIDCQCNAGTVESFNNEKACFQPCANEDEVLYATSTNTKLCCSTDFDAVNNKCCPTNSTFNGLECACVGGYEMNAAGTACELSYCPAGSHKSDDGYCVINPPIISASRFCELIGLNWNLASNETASCSTFTSSDDMDYYSDVYNAVLGNDGIYMSINSKVGAFSSITPNIVFANGLKLWILGDKAASIPGLSYYPTGEDANVSSTQNMCKPINLSDHSHAACLNAGGYYCKTESTCFTLDSASLTDMRDARNCCGAVDLANIQAAAEAEGVDWKRDPTAYAISGFTVFVDINGDKGNGTLWDDVYPFYIATNGTVYPAYPLNAPKSADSASDSLYIGGNSDKQLPADVYYYDSAADTRERKVAFSSVSYARALCSARKVSKFTPYCLNLGEKFNGGSADLTGTSYLADDNKATSVNPCDVHNCFVSVKNKLKNF